MAEFKAGFIGAGNMGGILAKAVNKATEDRVILCRSTAEHSKRTARETGCEWGSADSIILSSEYLFLCIKPQGLNAFASAHPSSLEHFDGILVSVLAGVTLQKLKEITGAKKIIRLMPNIPCSVGKGLMLMCGNEHVSAQELADLRELLREAGKTDILPEEKFDAGSAVSGCGPAFVYMFIQALADGGVAAGLPRDKALEYAAATVLGSAATVLESGKHPEKLKDEVCSPAGSTIEGVRALEEGGFRAACIEAVVNACNRNTELGKQ